MAVILVLDAMLPGRFHDIKDERAECDVQQCPLYEIDS